MKEILMPGFIDSVKVILLERVINTILDKATSGKRNKGSMYPFKLPKESNTKKPPSRKEVKQLVTSYFASPEGKALQGGFSVGERNRPLYHGEAIKVIAVLRKKLLRPC